MQENEQKNELPTKKFGQGIKPGEVRNPKGNPHIRELQKTGPKTREGKFWNNLLKYTANSTAKTLKAIRKCKTCPLGPIETKDSTIFRCKSWNPDRRTCVIPVENFLKQCKLLRAAQKEGIKKVAEYNMMKTLENAEIRQQRDLIVDGAPGHLTAEFRKLVSDQAQGLMRVTEGEKVKVESNVATLNVNEMLAKEKQKDDEEE